MKSFIKKITPPIIIDFYHSLKTKKDTPYLWSGIYSSFNDIKYDDDVWSSTEWIKISKDKLKSTLYEDEYSEGYIGLLINEINTMITLNNRCSVLDYGGGTGFIYYKIYSHINERTKCFYRVFDTNNILLSIGEAFRKKYHNIVFENDEKNILKSKYDILYINTTLQYIEKYILLFDKLLETEPKIIILTRLIAGNINTFITEQNVHGHKCPNIFIDFKELDNYFRRKNYLCQLKEKCLQEILNDYDKNIDKKYKLNNSINVIYKKKHII